MRRSHGSRIFRSRRSASPGRALCSSSRSNNNSQWNTRHSSTPADSSNVSSFATRELLDKRALPSYTPQPIFTTLHSSTPADSSTVSPSATRKFLDKKPFEPSYKPQTIFPWRHETILLPRLMDDSVDGGLLGPSVPSVPVFGWLAAFLLKQYAARHLNVPRYQALFGSAWKQELAVASGWAFCQAVAGVISNTYNVPFAEIRSEDGAIDFRTVTNNDAEKEKEEIEEGDNSKDHSETPEVDFMVEEKLRKLYESAHEFGRDQMRIHLQTQPISCKLVSLMVIPFITRGAVKDDPCLRHMLRKWYEGIENEIDLMNAFHRGKDSAEKMAKTRLKYHGDHATLDSTVIAQVLVTCEEIFAVTDADTGALVQGNGDKQIVPHLVRLEMVVEQKIYASGRSNEFTVGSWQIVDWDDLLGGNVWFL